MTSTSALPATAVATIQRSAGSRMAADAGLSGFGTDGNGAQHVGAQSARGEGGDEYVCVEADPHDTASKISSSVR